MHEKAEDGERSDHTYRSRPPPSTPSLQFPRHLCTSLCLQLYNNKALNLRRGVNPSLEKERKRQRKEVEGEKGWVAVEGVAGKRRALLSGSLACCLPGSSLLFGQTDNDDDSHQGCSSLPPVHPTVRARGAGAENREQRGSSGDRSPNAAGWRKVNRKQKVPMEEVYDICQDPGWAGDSAPPFCRPRVTHRTAVAEVVTTP
ncbi:uncharacterized protein LOC109204128 [Oreochromis niloticus]|uniref:uncharacterized protein LOC109204128 n=1 Tax=Oreochromis niloticus TaxID=8128 RepID=UPI000DF43C25|nr:uncharacterized protein LOC109204128 [Oreochromis niloticus]